MFLSAPDGLGGYDSVHAELTEIGRIVLETQYTQDLGNMDVFTAIKNCRVLSGTTNPTSAQGADGQMYVKYQTVSNVDEVVGLYVKLNGEWVEISTGGSGGDVGIECTQAQYDAWEQAGTLLEDTNYYITDGQSGGGVVIDDTTASTTTVYSSDKVEDLLSDKQNSTDNSLATTDKTIVGAINENKSVIGYSYDEYDATTAYSKDDLCIYNNVLYKAKQATTGNLPTNTTYWEPTSIADEIGRIDTDLSGKANKSYVDYSVNLGQGTYNGIYWIVREFYSFYLVEVGGTATTTFNWHTLVSVNNGYAPTMQRKVPISSYDHNYFRGSIGFNNGNIELKVDEAAYVCGQFILPKDLTA